MGAESAPRQRQPSQRSSGWSRGPLLLGGCLPGPSHPRGEQEGSCPGPKHWQGSRKSGRVSEASSCPAYSTPAGCWLPSPTRARIPPHFSRFVWTAVRERGRPVSASGGLGAFALPQGEARQLGMWTCHIRPGPVHYNFPRLDRIFLSVSFTHIHTHINIESAACPLMHLSSSSSPSFYHTAITGPHFLIRLHLPSPFSILPLFFLPCVPTSHGRTLISRKTMLLGDRRAE